MSMAGLLEVYACQLLLQSSDWKLGKELNGIWEALTEWDEVMPMVGKFDGYLATSLSAF